MTLGRSRHSIRHHHPLATRARNSIFPTVGPPPSRLMRSTGGAGGRKATVLKYHLCLCASDGPQLHRREDFLETRLTFPVLVTSASTRLSTGRRACFQSTGRMEGVCLRALLLLHATPVIQMRFGSVPLHHSLLPMSQGLPLLMPVLSRPMAAAFLTANPMRVVTQPPMGFTHHHHIDQIPT